MALESMSEHNPYAPPVAEVEAGPAEGMGLHRDGKLVRMGIGARFPDRCLRCNQPAASHRAERSLDWRPPWWRWTVGLSLLLLFVVSGVDPLVTRVNGDHMWLRGASRPFYEGLPVAGA